MSLAMKARQRVKRKGASKDRVFGCDLVEHLQLSGQDVPQVLKSCTEFVERHGIVDGIYRLSGVSSNIQKLRTEFDTDRTPDLHKDVYLQDIHCVSSLCKAYFRELPNPLLTYQLYDKFADAVAIQMEEGRLEKIKEVLKELPPPHYRTLEFLTKHLVHMASFSSQTNMHVRNLAIVWAPNLLRSKDIEASGFNGTAAFMEVRIQSIVVEFILTHVDQIFGDAPLRVGSRESLRKSLLLMSSPVPFSEEKYSFSYNVPGVLNQGDGPPQMRPYHTIIELTDSKRKGSLKGKKWKSIFNLGRYSHDSKRKLGKTEDKAAKMGLRPAKSMDSLSSVPCASKDEAQLGRNKSHKQLTLYRDSSDGPASLDPSFLELDEGPGEAKDPPGGGESEGEGTARSEPTTPKASRGSLVGASPQGRSPKAARNRAEKCVGVHISGPFSVMVPFHITSNLTLSRLTRGQECPALVHGCQEKEPTDSSVGKEGEDQEETAEGHQDATEEEEEEATGAETKTDGLNDAEVNRMSMEVQDSFSFLDGQDAWLGDSLQEDPPLQSFPAPPDFMGAGLDDRPSAEDDLGSGFMSEMLGSEMQLAMFSSLPPLDYLSIEECMDEHLGDEEEYYLATDCVHGEPPPKESDSEEVYLSAFDDLSPLAHKPGDLQPPDEVRESGANPPQGTLEDQPFSLLAGPSLEGHARSLLPEDEREPPRLGSPPPQGPGGMFFHLDPEFQANLGSESGESETQQEGEGKATTEMAAGLGSPVTPSEAGATSGPDGEGVLPQTVALGNTELDGGAVQEKTLQRSLAVDRGEQVAPSRPEDEQSWPLETQAVFQDGPLPCPLRVAGGVEADGWAPSGASSKPSGSGLPSQAVEQPHSREAVFCPETARTPSPTEDPSSLGAHPPSSPGRFPENASSRRSPGLTPGGLPAESLDPTGDPLPEWGPLQPSFISSKSFPEIHLQKPRPLPRGEPPTGFTPELSDGSVPMKLTSSTVRVQQARSFPVVPPKPQFAKIPPDLQPRAPAKEATGPGPDASVVFGEGTKEGLGQGSLPRLLRPASLDMSCSHAGRHQNTGGFSASTGFLDNGRDESGAHQKERNSMPGSLEKYGRRSKGRAHCAPKSLPSPLDETGLWPEKGRTDGEDPGPRRCPAFETQEGSQPKKGDGNGAAMRWVSSRRHKKGSISFDEAVSLAKERHRGQAPVRRMQTYCYGDGDGPRAPLQAEPPGPQVKPALKPPGEGPRRPGSGSCLGGTAPSEAPAPRKAIPPQALPNVLGWEGALPPSQEGLPPPHGGQPWRRMSLAKIGRRASVSEESPCATAPEWR